jgi:hypothetical protein
LGTLTSPSTEVHSAHATASDSTVPQTAPSRAWKEELGADRLVVRKDRSQIHHLGLDNDGREILAEVDQIDQLGPFSIVELSGWPGNALSRVPAHGRESICDHLFEDGILTAQVFVVEISHQHEVRIGVECQVRIHKFPALQVPFEVPTQMDAVEREIGSIDSCRRMDEAPPGIQANGLSPLQRSSGKQHRSFPVPLEKSTGCCDLRSGAAGTLLEPHQVQVEGTQKGSDGRGIRVLETVHVV